LIVATSGRILVGRPLGRLSGPQPGVQSGKHEVNDVRVTGRGFTMPHNRALAGLVAMIGTLLAFATPSYAVKVFAPENGAVTGTGGEAKFFSNQIVCAKNKLTGEIKKLFAISKIEGPVTYEECLFGVTPVESFISPTQGFNINNAPGIANGSRQTVSFRETTIKVEGGCVVTILAGGLNLLQTKASYKNEPVTKVKATINIQSEGANNGLIYKTNKTACGTLAEKEEQRTAFTGTETINSAEIIERAAKCGEEEEKEEVPSALSFAMYGRFETIGLMEAIDGSVGAGVWPLGYS
jgi:hypothetical protein